ncbi:MAG: hypothetical protein ACOCUL_02145 [Bacteroidota bacterium]
MNKIGFLLSIFLFSLSSCENLETGDPRDQIVGSWKVDEVHDQFKMKEVYDVDIEKHPSDSSKIIIVNFYNLIIEAEGSYYGDSVKLTPNQILEDGTIIFSGGGTVSNNYNQIDLQYKLDGGDGKVVNATAKYTKF